MYLSYWSVLVLVAFLVIALIAGAFFAPAGFTVAMSIGYILIGVVLIGTIVAILNIRDVLLNSKWSLAEALSEDIDVTTDDPANPGKTLIVSGSKSSMSRLIALMGMMAILILYVCIGAACIWSLVQSGKFPDSALQGAAFLTSGLSLFVPYMVNKATSK
jgi:amino acid transporter